MDKTDREEFETKKKERTGRGCRKNRKERKRYKNRRSHKKALLPSVLIATTVIIENVPRNV